MRAHFSTRCGSSSFAAHFARFPSQPHSWSQWRIVSAETSSPRRMWSSGARAAQLHRGRHQPNARGALVRSAGTERLRDGGSRRSRRCFVVGSLASSKVRGPPWYARTSRYTLEREQKSTAATSLGVRPAAHKSSKWRASQCPYRARRNSARIWACWAGGLSTLVVRGTETPR